MAFTDNNNEIQLAMTLVVKNQVVVTVFILAIESRISS